MTGPMLGDLFHNFNSAWKKETGKDLTAGIPKPLFERYPLSAATRELQNEAPHTQLDQARQTTKDEAAQAGALSAITEHDANVPPPLPTEARIKEMAKAKNLDPETGRPRSNKRAEAPAPVKLAVPTVPLGTQLASGTRCSQSGVWQCNTPTALGGDRRFFTAGETLPSVIVPIDLSWLQKLKGDPKNEVAEATWTLVEWPKPTKDA